MDLGRDAGRRLHVLIVGALTERHELVRRSVEELGWTLDHAHDGAMAGRMVENDYFDLVLVDLLAGAEAAARTARRVRGVEASRWQPPTPIIGLGVRTRDFDERMVTETGFNGCLNLSGDVNELRSCLERWTSIRRPRSQVA